MTPPEFDVPRESLTAVVGVTADAPLPNNDPSLEPLLQTDAQASLIIPACFPLQARFVIEQLIACFTLELQQQLLDEVAENHRINPNRTIPLRLLRCLASLATEGKFNPELCFLYAERRIALGLTTNKQKNKELERTRSREQIEVDRLACCAVLGIKPGGRK